MANSLRLILSAILLLSLIQPGNAKTSTENLIVNESDILEFKKSSKIDEADFFEDVQTNSEEHVWVVNLKNGPFSTKEKANQAALKLKKNIGDILPKLPKEISILQKPNLPKHKNFNKVKYEWMTNLRLGVYDSKGKALQIAHDLKAFQSVPENVFLTRETKGIKTSKFAEKITPDVIGQIFLSREATPFKDKTKHFILVATRSNSLNVRKNPSSSSPVVASLIRGSKVPHIKNNTPENRDGSWFYVEYSKGKFGWVSRSYTKKVIDTGSSISQQASLKTLKPKQVQKTNAPRTSELLELKSLVTLLQTQLDKIKTDKILTTGKTNQANTKEKQERLASIEEFEALKNKSSAEINDLRTITAFLRSELNKIKSDKSNAIKARNRSRAEFEISVDKSNKKIKALKTTTASLLSELTQIKKDKAKIIVASNQANAKANDEKLASTKEFKSFKETNSKQIKDLKGTTASLLSELDKIKIDKAQAIEATNQANEKAKQERLASAKEFQSLKETNSKQIKDLKTTTASLRLELEKIKNDKAKAVEASNQAKARLQKEKLTNAKLVTSLKVDNEKKILNLREKNNNKTKNLKEKNLKEIVDLRFSTASLQKELKKINSAKEDAIINFNQVNAKLQTTSLNNFKFTKKLKDTVLSLRKQLDIIKGEKSKSTRLVNQTNDQLEAKILTISTKLKNIKEASHEKTLELNNTVSYLRAQLNKAKNDKTNKLTAINQASIKSNKKFKESSTREIKTLNLTIKNLRTVLEKFKVERLKEAETIKSRETKIAIDQTIREREISLLKKESVALKRQLDKINLNRLKAIEGVNQNSIAAQADHIAQENKFKKFRLESAGEIAKLREETTLLHNQLAHLKADRTKSSQPKTLLSSSKKLSGLTGNPSTKQKNKAARFPDQQDKKKSISEKKDLPPSNKVNPENIIKSKLLHWVNAWESRNVPLYLSFYSKSFKDPKRSRSRWETYRRKSLEKALSITIKISNIKIYSPTKKSIKVTFSQRFKSNRFSDIGLKELVWKKGTDGWKIIKETWKPR